MSDAPPSDDRRAYVLVLSGEAAGAVLPIERELVVGRGKAARLRVRDEDVSRAHARLSFDEAERVVWLEDLGSRNGTLLNGREIERARVSDGDRIQVGARTLLKLAFQSWLEASFFTTMREGALRDPRTGLFARPYLIDRVRAELSYASAHGLPLSVVRMRVDPEALPGLARTLERTLRSEDVLARPDEDELAIVLRGVDAAGARALADRIQGGSSIRALGTASRLDADDPEDLLERARRA